jgi:hypothetical protein
MSKPCDEGTCDPLTCTESVCLNDLNVPEHEQVDEWPKQTLIEPNVDEWGTE